MTIISVQNLLGKCHNKTILRDIAFSRPLYIGNVKFFRRILQEPNKNKILCGQGILGRDQVIFTIYGGISGVEESKNTCEPVFSITNKTSAADCRCRRTTPQGAKPLHQLTFIRPQQRFREVFGLKRPSMYVPNLFFARPQPKLPSALLFSIIGIGKGRQDVLPAP